MSTEASNATAEGANPTPAERRDRFARLYRHIEALLSGKSYRRIEVKPYRPLILERLSPSEVSMTQYGTRNGDLMRDPEVIFEVRQEDGLTLAEPFYYRNDCIGGEQYTRFRLSRKPVDGSSYRPDRHDSLCRFATEWFRNLRQQGFFEAEESSATVW